MKKNQHTYEYYVIVNPMKNCNIGKMLYIKPPAYEWLNMSSRFHAALFAIFNETFCYTMHEWLVDKYVSLVGEWSRNNEAFARTHKYCPGMAIFLSLNIDYHILRLPTFYIITTFFYVSLSKIGTKESTVNFWSTAMF